MMDKNQIREAARNIRLIAVDMDGTCLSSKKEFTPRTRRALQALIDRGILIVPATGRAYHGLVDKVMGLRGVRYVISADGAFVTDCSDGGRIWEQLIPCETAAAILDDLLADGNCVFYHRDDADCTHIMACTSREEYRQKFWRPEFQVPEEIVTADFGQYLLQGDGDVAKLGLFFTRSDGFDFYESLLKEKYPGVSYFRSDENVLEVTSCRTGKGEALKALAERLSIPREQILAIGDNGNDIGMIVYAGIGVAMENGIAALREQADFIAGSNDEEGVAGFLEEFF